jgi:hypothetical protein
MNTVAQKMHRRKRSLKTETTYEKKKANEHMHHRVSFTALQIGRLFHAAQ